jgi:succinate dehydrogenase/fumarate reductase flavoprotein subunit
MTHHHSLLSTLADWQDSAEVDVLVIGAGGSGMAAALCAALEGARVVLVEHTEFVGGTTAWSAGTAWVPGTHHAKAVNPSDTLADAATYLNHAVGDRTSPELRQAFLQAGPQAIADLEKRTSLRFRPYPKHPDYISELEGSTLNGRALEPYPFDGRLLGALFDIIRPPIPEFTVLGGMMVDRTDINHLLGMTRSWTSLRHSVGIVLRHAVDRLRYARGTRLVMGNALVARLLYSLAQIRTAKLLLNAEVTALETNNEGAITKVTISQSGAQKSVKVRGGVILASGGFNRHPQKREQWLPGAPPAWCPAAPGHTGRAQDLALTTGATYGASCATPAFWAPVSLRQRPDGSTAAFPHFVMDRAKPGMLTVDRAGRRFVNESTSYHLFGLTMHEKAASSETVPAYLICDARALRTYGLGMVRPGGKGLAPFLADGYLTEDSTLEGLANKLGISAQGLLQSVEEIKQSASSGVDSRFHRGETAYQLNIGDASWQGSNPCLGALTEAPYYAVKLYPGDIGAAKGLATDGLGRVHNTEQAPIAGLYAVGNDMHSIMGGIYTGPGITIGPGLVFGYLAGRHAAARALQGV